MASKRVHADPTNPREEIWFSKSMGVVSVAGFLLGATLGLMGRLPGTQDG